LTDIAVIIMPPQPISVGWHCPLCGLLTIYKPKLQ